MFCCLGCQQCSNPALTMGLKKSHTMWEVMRPWEQKLFEKVTTNIFCMNCWHAYYAFTNGLLCIYSSLPFHPNTISECRTHWAYSIWRSMSSVPYRDPYGSADYPAELHVREAMQGFQYLKCQFLCGTVRNTKCMLLKYTIPIQREIIKVWKYFKSCNVPEDRRFLPIK